MKHTQKLRTIFFLILFLLFASVAWVVLINHFSLFENETYIGAIVVLTSTSLLLMSVLTIIEISTKFFDKDSTWNTAIFTICAFILLIFANNSVTFFTYSFHWTFDYTLFEKFSNVINVLSFSTGMLSLLNFFVRTYKINVNKEEMYITAIIATMACILNVSFLFIDYSFLGTILVIALAIFWLFKIGLFARLEKDKIVNGAFYSSYVIFAIFIMVEIYEMIGFSNQINVSNFGITSVYMILIFFAFLFIYLSFTLRITKEAYKKREYEAKISELQTNVLKNQINPHFIFNALNIIKALYNEDIEKGNRALELFSKNLRAYTDAGDKYLVSLNEELDIISAYVDLENMKKIRPFNIIYDIDVYDFKVPFFAIETLVENSIKYSHVNERENGEIVIKTEEDENNYYITVSDNGDGFDPKTIRNKSHGIENSKERFMILLNAEFNLYSDFKNGTKIYIKIPKGERK